MLRYLSVVDGAEYDSLWLDEMCQEADKMGNKLKEQQYRTAAEAGHDAAAVVARYEGGETRPWRELTVAEQSESWQRLDKEQKDIPEEKKPLTEAEGKVRKIRDEVTQLVLRHLESSKGSESQQDVAKLSGKEAKVSHKPGDDPGRPPTLDNPKPPEERKPAVDQPKPPESDNFGKSQGSQIK